MRVAKLEFLSDLRIDRSFYSLVIFVLSPCVWVVDGHGSNVVVLHDLNTEWIGTVAKLAEIGGQKSSLVLCIDEHQVIKILVLRPCPKREKSRY